jgi:hypothetical protein
MRHFILLLLLAVFSVVCFGQNTQPGNKSEQKAKSRQATSQPPKLTGARTKRTKPKAQPTAEKTDATKTKPKSDANGSTDAESKEKPKAETKAKPVDSSKVKSEEKPKPQTAIDNPKVNKPKTEATPKPKAEEKKSANNVKPAEKPKKQAANTAAAVEQIKTAEVKPKDKPKLPQTAALEPCHLTLKDAPVIRNLRLGMARDEVDQIIPNDSRVKYINSSTITSYPYFTNAAGFENIYQITAKFYENRMNGLEIAYDTNAVEWKNVQEFARNLSDNLKVPFNAWRFSKSRPNFAEMRCKEFALEIDSALNELTLQNSTSTEGIQQANDNNKKGFKP